MVYTVCNIKNCKCKTIARMPKQSISSIENKVILFYVKFNNIIK